MGVKGESHMALATSSGFGEGGGVSPVPFRGLRTEREGVSGGRYLLLLLLMLL